MSVKMNDLSNVVTILNTSILTSFGSYDYRKISLEEAKIICRKKIQSAIGHQSTADILTKLLEKDIPINRIQYTQNMNEIAIVFKLKGRPEEGKILTIQEIEEIGYEFGVLIRTT